MYIRHSQLGVQFRNWKQAAVHTLSRNIRRGQYCSHIKIGFYMGSTLACWQSRNSVSVTLAHLALWCCSSLTCFQRRWRSPTYGSILSSSASAIGIRYSSATNWYTSLSNKASLSRHLVVRDAGCIRRSEDVALGIRVTWCFDRRLEKTHRIIKSPCDVRNQTSP